MKYKLPNSNFAQISSISSVRSKHDSTILSMHYLTMIKLFTWHHSRRERMIRRRPSEFVEMKTVWQSLANPWQSNDQIQVCFPGVTNKNRPFKKRDQFTDTMTELITYSCIISSTPTIQMNKIAAAGFSNDNIIYRLQWYIYKLYSAHSHTWK